MTDAIQINETIEAWRKRTGRPDGLPHIDKGKPATMGVVTAAVEAIGEAVAAEIKQLRERIAELESRPELSIWGHGARKSTPREVLSPRMDQFGTRTEPRPKNPAHLQIGLWQSSTAGARGIDERAIPARSKGA